MHMRAHVHMVHAHAHTRTEEIDEQKQTRKKRKRQKHLQWGRGVRRQSTAARVVRERGQREALIGLLAQHQYAAARGQILGGGDHTKVTSDRLHELGAVVRILISAHSEV